MRARAALGLVPLLALALAGCVSTSEPLVSAQGALRFLDALAMDQPTGGAEPNIAVLGEDTIFITAVAGSQEQPNALEGAAWLWRSTDAGATWETLRAPVRETPLGTIAPTRRPFGSSDADVVTSPDGWVYYTDWWNWGLPIAGLPVASSRYGSYLVERSGDAGATWESAPVTTLDSLGGVDRQWLVAGEDGFVGLFYAYFHGPQNAVRTAGDLYGRADAIMSINAVFSTDHGATWGDPVLVVPPVSGKAYQIAHPRMVGNASIVMPYGEVLDTNVQRDDFASPSMVRLMVSDNLGATWEARTIAEVPEGFDNLWAVQGAVDATGLLPSDAGHIYVAWAARTGETMTMFLSRSGDGGTTWSAPQALRAEGLNFLPWVAAKGDGTVAVGWYGGDATGKPEEAAEDAAWFAYAAESTDGGRTFTVAKVSEEPVKVGPLCPKGAACTGNRELLDYVSLEYDAQGRLHYAFARSREVAGTLAGQAHYAGGLAAQN